jgi:cytidylate kinase
MSRSAARRRPIIAIDGPAASGKSTAGKALAARLGYLYIDTGALYRAVGWLASQAGITPEKPKGLADLMAKTEITLAGDASDRKVLVGGSDVSGEIRTEEIGHLASAFSALPQVREALLDIQRQLGAGGGVVMDGRDIGTVIFPDAEVKIFLSASDSERSSRRWRELVDRGQRSDPEEVRRDLSRRDGRDRNRPHAPLRAAPDAVSIDSTGLSPEDVVERILSVVEERA